MSRRFRIGDRIFHPDYPNDVYEVIGIDATNYDLHHLNKSGWFYMDYKSEGNFKLIGEMAIDRVLEKYKDEV